MKKILVLLCAFVLIVSLAACDISDVEPSDNNDVPSQSEANNEETDNKETESSETEQSTVEKTKQYRFMSDAECEGITYGDNVKPTERPVDDIMALQPNGTICFLGWAGRVCYHYAIQNNIIRVDYEKYINGDADFIITK